MARLPRFEDYHRTVIGYHGTRRSVALSIVSGEATFARSANASDWLGHGVYFWEYAPQQAWNWANRLRKARGWEEEIAVVGSMIRLGNCFDLLDPYNLRRLRELYKDFQNAFMVTGQTMPVNVKARKYLDCAVLQYAYATFDDVRQPIDTCRAVYVPNGKESRAWKSSWLTKDAHIQICVRNEACILGTWLAKPAAQESNDAES